MVDTLHKQPALGNILISFHAQRDGRAGVRSVRRVEDDQRLRLVKVAHDQLALTAIAQRAYQLRVAWHGFGVATSSGAGVVGLVEY